MRTADADTLNRLYINHGDWLRGFLQRRLGCQETAAELAQDTFVRLLARGEDASQIDQPRAYLSRIGQGLLANHWRRRDIEQAYHATFAEQPVEMAPDPETHQAVIETLWHVDGLLRELPTKVRYAFLRSRLEGARYADIAADLGVSERMVKKYMARAMLHCLRAEDSWEDAV